MQNIFSSLPPHVILSTTIETNRTTYKVSKAPSPIERFKIFSDLDWPRKHISIEPILKFDMVSLVKMMEQLGDTSDLWISVGFDNYGTTLPEPSHKEVDALIDRLRRSNVITGVEDKRQH